MLKIPPQEIRIEPITSEDTLPVRHRVLWPDKPVEHCIVEGDSSGTHFGLFIREKLVGVASLYENNGAVRLRKFAVESSLQGEGLGSLLLTHAILHARASGATIFWCDARESALSFYQRFGLEAEGERFYKSEVPYLKMSLPLEG